MKRSLWAIALLILGSWSASAQATMRLEVGRDSRLWIEGTSNLRGWSCKAASLDAQIEVELGFREAADFPRYLKSVQVKVPVSALQCGHERMNRDLRHALRADDGTPIQYVMATFDAVGNGESNGYIVHTVGTLTLAGRENTVKMDVNATQLAAGGVEARGEVPILMTAYGIKPPTALFGAIRAGDRVVVKFDLTVTPNAIAAVSALSGELPATERQP